MILSHSVIGLKVTKYAYIELYSKNQFKSCMSMNLKHIWGGKKKKLKWHVVGPMCALVARKNCQYIGGQKIWGAKCSMKRAYFFRPVGEKNKEEKRNFIILFVSNCNVLGTLN